MTLRGDRITKLRKESGIKQYDLADKLGVARNQISKYENGYSNPTLETLTKMAEIFNTTADYLLGLSNIPHPGAEPDANPDLTPSEIEWLSLFRDRSAADQKRILEIMEIMRVMRGDD